MKLRNLFTGALAGLALLTSVGCATGIKNQTPFITNVKIVTCPEDLKQEGLCEKRSDSRGWVYDKPFLNVYLIKFKVPVTTRDECLKSYVSNNKEELCAKLFK